MSQRKKHDFACVLRRKPVRVVKTTLYKLIETVQEEAAPWQQELVPKAVDHILKTRRARSEAVERPTGTHS